MFDKYKNYKNAWLELKKWLEENYNDNKFKPDILSDMQSKTQETNLKFVAKLEEVYRLR